MPDKKLNDALKWYTNAAYLNFRQGPIETQWSVSLPLWYLQEQFPEFLGSSPIVKEDDKLYCDDCNWASKRKSEYANERGQQNGLNSHKQHCKGQNKVPQGEPDNEAADETEVDQDDHDFNDNDDNLQKSTPRNDGSKSTVKRTRSQSQSKKAGDSIGSKSAKKAKKAEEDNSNELNQVPLHTLLLEITNTICNQHPLC